MRVLGKLWRAPGWRREDLEIAPWAIGGPWEVLEGSLSDLSLRFPLFGGICSFGLAFSNASGLRTLWYVFFAMPNRPGQI